MNFVYQCKVVGLTYHKVQNAVEQGDYVILVVNTENPVDSDCIEVYNAERELVGYIANSDKTLSQNNRKNGNISASELKENLDFTGKEFYGEVIKAFSSCLYLEVNEGKWSYTNQPIDEVPELTFKRAIDLLEPEVVEVPAHKVDVIEPIGEDATLVAEIAELKLMVAELLAGVDVDYEFDSHRMAVSLFASDGVMRPLESATMREACELWLDRHSRRC